MQLPAAATLVAGATLAARLGTPLGLGTADALACASCRACDATGDRCPGEIPRISEMVAAAHTGDLARFVLHRGLLCVRCENCSAACPANLDLTRLFGAMQARARAADALDPGLRRAALAQGLLGPEFSP